MYAPRTIVALETASAVEGTTSRCSARRLLRVITAIRPSARPLIDLRLSWQGRKPTGQRTLSHPAGCAGCPERHSAGAAVLILFMRFRNNINSPACMSSSRARISDLKGLGIINGQRVDRETGGGRRWKPQGGSGRRKPGEPVGS